MEEKLNGNAPNEREKPQEEEEKGIDAESNETDLLYLIARIIVDALLMGKSDERK